MVRGGEKRKRSPSPPRSLSPRGSPVREASPKRKKDTTLTESFLSFFSPAKSQGGSAKKREKKRLSFGAPQVHRFDVMSPARRRRPEADDAHLDASHLDSETLKVELRCRQEENPDSVDVDIEKGSHKALSKAVNQLWKEDQLNQLESKGLCCPKDRKSTRGDLAKKLVILQGLERKANVLMSGEHPALPSQMDAAQLSKELVKRRIHTDGERPTLERRLEEAWLKEGARFDVNGNDGYAFGRHAVSALDVIEELSDKELRLKLLQPRWQLSRADIPRKRADRQQLLERLEGEALQSQRELAFNMVLNDQLESIELETQGPLRERFDRLCKHMKEHSRSDLRDL